MCIVGAGPAGLAIACSFDRPGRRVIVVERGGEPGGPEGVRAGDIAVGNATFEPPPMPPPRFGGAANEWIVRLPWHRRGVRMLPLSPIDLERREWIPDSGWPLSWGDLVPFYERAHRLLDLGPFDYEVAAWEEEGAYRLPLDRLGVTTGMERVASAGIFTSRMWAAMKSTKNVRVMLGASVGALAGREGHLRSAEIDHGRRARFSINAEVFVLAASGLENPRLMLASNDGRGIGNPYDIVGRFHVDHVRAVSGTLTPINPALFEQLKLYDIQPGTNVGGRHRMGKLVPTVATMRSERLPHSAAQMLPKLSADTRETIASVIDAARSIRRGERPQHRPALDSLVRTAGIVAETAIRMTVRQRRFPPRTDAGWANLHRNRYRWSTLELEHQLEQLPNSANRTYLDRRVDGFGRRRVSIDWRWTDNELQGFRRTQHLFERAFEASRIANFVPAEWDDFPRLTTPGGTFHPSGGTRMSSNPRRGVVDANSQVHDWHNLFVAGSSVFPTVGYANPTLTIIALAFRLADEIERRLPANRVR